MFQAVSFQAASPLSSFCLPSACNPGHSEFPAASPPLLPAPSFVLSFPGPLTKPLALFLAFPLLACTVQTFSLALGPFCSPLSLAVDRCLPRESHAGAATGQLPPWSNKRPTAYNRETCQRELGVTQRVGVLGNKPGVELIPGFIQPPSHLLTLDPKHPLGCAGIFSLEFVIRSCCVLNKGDSRSGQELSVLRTSRERLRSDA